MKTKIFTRCGILGLFIAINSCTAERIVEDTFDCASGSIAACCSFNPDSPDCTGFVNEKTGVETDSTLAVSKLPVRE